MSIKTKFNRRPKSKFRGLRLDPEIVDLVIKLNKAGYSTLNSCAGHSTSGPGNLRGFVALRQSDDKAGIVAILDAFGLTDIRVMDGVWGDFDHDGDWYFATLISFSPIGQLKGWQINEDDWDQLDNERQLLLL